MNVGRLIRTIWHLKPRQVWFQVWRRVQRRFEPHPACAANPLPAFAFLNVTASPRGWNDTSLELLWRYNLHYFDYLHSHSAESSLVFRWIEENPRGSFPGWEPYPTSLRIVNWVKHLERYQTQIPNRSLIETSIREQLDWLARHLEWHILANHLLANLKALVIGAKWLDGDAARWMPLYRRQIEEQILDDGSHSELSAMYHAIVFEDVIDVLHFCGEEAAWLRPTAGRMLTHLLKMTGPDGMIAKFNDAAEGIAKTPEQLIAAAAREGVAPERPINGAVRSGDRSSGYVRVSAGEWTLISKGAVIGLDYQPGHAHADSLSFELWRGEVKVIGDTGCSTYVPGPIRSYERSTAAHNTVVIDGRNSSEVWAAHRVGERCRALRANEPSGRTGVWAHDCNGMVIGRRLVLKETGLCGIDEIRGTGEHEIEERFHLPPGVSLEQVSIACSGERLVERCDFAVGWNRREAGTCVVYRQRMKLPAKIEWSIA